MPFVARVLLMTLQRRTTTLVQSEEPIINDRPMIHVRDSHLFAATACGNVADNEQFSSVINSTVTMSPF